MNYQNRIVAFIDILGFEDRIRKTRYANDVGKVIEDADSIKTLYAAFKRIRYVMGIDEPTDDFPDSRKVAQFSDLIFISFDFNEEKKELQYLLGELLFLHVELARYNLLIRGGISYGPLIHTDEIVFGPALIQAFRLESRAAKSPRIILPKSLYDLDSEFFELMATKDRTGNLDGLVSLDEDDFYYLDYFDKCRNPELGIFLHGKEWAQDVEYIEHMKKLRFLITSGLASEDPGIYSKYGWMKSKWNAVVNKNKMPENLIRLKQENKLNLYSYFNQAKLIQTSL